ncbi:MAG: 50S ribosomal protein L9 [Candidatus Paceibacterota bacterium]|jgi:large subunit ribosomal protein L9
MKVILLKNIPKLGKKNEIKEVSVGYANNFLFPKKLALAATEEKLAQLENIIKQEEEKAEAALKETEALVAKLDGREIIIGVKVGKEGQVYESITKQKISEKLKAQNFKIEKSQIKLENPIKELGEFDVGIEFDHNLEAEIKIIITEKEEE